MKLGTMVLETPLGPARRIAVETGIGILDATAARIALRERDLPRAVAARVGQAEVPPDILALLEAGEAGMDWVSEAVGAVLRSGQEHTAGGAAIRHDPARLRLIAPVPRPPGVANFSAWPAHGAAAAAKGFNLQPAEQGSGVMPYWKGNPDSYIGPGEELRLPPYATELDVECELVCIVGTGGRDLDREAARQAIAGYTIVNDTSVRDIQRAEMKTGRGPAKGKDFDGGNVMGPWIVTPDEIGDIATLRLSLHVNGEELSSSTAEGMTWEFADMLAYLSRGQTIHPGHVISAGCYAGGSAMDLDRRLNPGDLVELRISRIGSLINRIASA